MAGVFENWVRRVCEKIAEGRDFMQIPRDAKPYLIRYYLLPAVKEQTAPKQLKLHHFRRSDADRELHNHPHSWGLALILTGGYREERRVKQPDGSFTIRTKTFKPFSFNLIRANDYHRVDLLDEVDGCWTLFLNGPRVQVWHFWCRDTYQYTYWEDFISRKNADLSSEERHLIEKYTEFGRQLAVSAHQNGRALAQQLKSYVASADTYRPPYQQSPTGRTSCGSDIQRNPIGPQPPPWIPDDHADDDAPYNGDEEAFERKEKA